MSKDKSNVVRFLDPKNARLSGQERVNAEIFTALEILGRKLERTEAERDHLAERLEMIESAATLDEETGKIYLPAVIDSKTADRLTHRSPARIATVFSIASFAMAAVALGLTMAHNPETFPQAALWYQDAKAQITTYQPAPHTAETAAAAPADEPVLLAPQAEPAPALPPVMEDMPEASTQPKPETAFNAPPVEAIPAAAATPAPAVSELAATSAPAVNTPAGDALPETHIESTLPSHLKNLETLARSGAAEAQHDLGILYAEGRLVPTDYPQAVYWLEKASRQGVANATYNLAVIYQQGLGVAANKKGAIALYEEAAAQGHAEAMYNLGIIYFSGDGIAADASRGAEYFEQAAKAGVIEAAYNLGVLNESNFMGEIDLGKAIQWYEIAAKQGYPKATEALARIRGAAKQSITEEEKTTAPN